MRLSLRVFAISLGVLGLGATAGCDEPEPPAWSVAAQALPEALLSVGGTSARDVWAVGADRGQGPVVLHFDGAAWKRHETGLRGNLWWVHAFEGGPVFFGGGSSTILRFDDQGFERMLTPGIAHHTIFGLWGAAPDDLYAVGSVSSKNGFIWRYDGQRWLELEVPDTLPRDASGDNPGFFKVWGNGRGKVWVCGGRGTLLESENGGPFRVVPTGMEESLFTVAGVGDEVVVVGGGGSGVLLETDGRGAPRAQSISVGLLQGVALTADGRGYATGAGGAVLAREGGRWQEVRTGLALTVESLHAVWIDPSGGVWAAGGNVLGSKLDAGALIHLGPAVPAYTYDPKPDILDPKCPESLIDPEPSRSMVRRWSEQQLGAIRRDIPMPTVHARNLFHVSAAMWDAWAAYEAEADGYFFREKVSAENVPAARDEAIAYAAFGVLMHRYSPSLAAGGKVSQDCFTKFMTKLGYDPQDKSTEGSSPRAVGNRIAQRVLAAGKTDGSNEGAKYADTTMYMRSNPPLVVDEPRIRVSNPALWQELTLLEAETQNGIPVDAGVQPYIGAHWREVRPFAMTRAQPNALYHDPGLPPAFDARTRAMAAELVRRHSKLDPGLEETIDISPGAYGNNPLGTNDGRGHPQNPVTGAPYAPQVVKLGDFVRVLAEVWADGPKSETPPGHWNSIAHDVADTQGFERRWRGLGEPLDALAWDARIHFAINGAVHDAAIAAWQIKREFLGVRPITLIRYMAQLGQSSDPSAPSYHPEGLPLMAGVIELITEESSARGQRHAHLRRYLGQVAVRSWRGEPGDRKREIGGVAWIRGVEWIPYQRRTFVTPAFPGFVSGHSTFSRAAAEVLTEATGSPYYPGGLGKATMAKDSVLVFERGPSETFELQWGTYYDAADQAGQSRLWGGIHIEADDLPGRRVGSQIGRDAFALAERYFAGTAD